MLLHSYILKYCSDAPSTSAMLVSRETAELTTGSDLTPGETFPAARSDSELKELLSAIHVVLEWLQTH